MAEAALNLGVHQSEDLETYAAAVIPFLEAEPSRRNVLRSIIEIGRQGTGAWRSSPSYWWVTDGDRVVGAALCTPPWSLLVSSLPAAAIPAFVDRVAADARGRGWRLNGVTGPRRDADAVAALLGAALHVDRGEPRVLLLHELRSVRDVSHPEGASRRAEARDAQLVATWLRAFAAELDMPGAEAEASAVPVRIETGEYDLWEVDATPVSMANHTVPLAGVVRIGGVYTPPEQRLRGYARRLVAEVSTAALRLPQVSRCMLYTEATNPVSNAIYRQIGYAAVEEHADIRFAWAA